MMSKRYMGLTLFFATVFALPSIAGKPEFLAKRDPNHLRLLCYNINWDAIFADNDPQNHKWRRYSRQDAFVRVLVAVDPDIVCLQEINPDRKPQQLATMLNRAIPVDPDDDSKVWNVYMGRDNVIAAPFPLSMTGSDTNPPTNRGHAMALIDLPDDKYPRDLYIINAHMKSAGGPQNIAKRQKHADAVMSWLRDAREPGGSIDLPRNTAFVMCGDFNVYDNDHRRHHFTLLTGDIDDEKTFGADFLPDWDNTILGDVLPVHNARSPYRWTWRDDSTPYNPGPLDRIIYTDSVLDVAHAFVLNTTEMTAEELKASGLKKDDVSLDYDKGVFDHLPMLVDFAFRAAPKPTPAPAP